MTDLSVTHSAPGNHNPRLVDLALQGGGSHGAFTWGVLDRLLEEARLQIEGVSGTSAGAMKAAVLVSGFEHGGPTGARKSLERFWRRVSDAAAFSPFRRTPFDMLAGRWTLDQSQRIGPLGEAICMADNGADHQPRAVLHQDVPLVTEDCRTLLALLVQARIRIEALVRFSDEELKHQALFRRIDQATRDRWLIEHKVFLF